MVASSNPSSSGKKGAQEIPGSGTSKTEPSKQIPGSATGQASKQNPAFRMLGIPNFRAKLPSRNWLIFFGVAGSIATAISYDRRQKKAAQKKWCDLVDHIAHQPLPVNQMPRKLTVFLSAPPGDGIRPSREYFKEYIKPILVAAAMDYDVIEGRKEGDVRYGAAEQIRRLRRRKGEASRATREDNEVDREQAVEMARQQLKIDAEPAVKGDLVIGRHTWKEYLRGVHEGWLGPLDDPTAQTLDPPTTTSSTSVASQDPQSSSNTPANDKDQAAQETQTKSEEKKQNSTTPAPYISSSGYPSAILPPHLPKELEPSAPIPHRHILGFLNSPIRIYHFFNQRCVADAVGRDTAAVVLGFHRPYRQINPDLTSSLLSSSSSSSSSSPSTTDPKSSLSLTTQNEKWEQQSLLASEESNWHKSVFKVPVSSNDSDETTDRHDLNPVSVVERVWLDNPIMDPRIAQRMRRFELATEDEDRASRIGEGLEGSLWTVKNEDEGEVNEKGGLMRWFWQ